MTKQRVVVLVDVDAGRGASDLTGNWSLPQLEIRASTLRSITALHKRQQVDGANFWGWKFFSHRRSITQRSSCNAFVDLSPKTFSKFSDQLQHHVAVQATRKSTSLSSSGASSHAKLMLIKALTDVVTKYSWDMPDIASPVRGGHKAGARDAATTTATTTVTTTAASVQAAAHHIIVFTECPTTCQAWATFHGVTSASLSKEAIQKLSEEKLLPQSLLGYFERYCIQVTFVDVSHNGVKKSPSSHCHGFCGNLQQYLSALLPTVTVLSLADHLYGNGQPITSVQSGGVTCSATQSEKLHACPLLYEDRWLCCLQLLPYLSNRSKTSMLLSRVSSVRVIGLLRTEDMPFVATETMACIGMSLCGSRLSARFQQLMQLVACDSLSMAVSLCLKNGRRLFGLLVAHTCSTGLIRLCDDDWASVLNSSWNGSSCLLDDSNAEEHGASLVCCESASHSSPAAVASLSTSAEVAGQFGDTGATVSPLHTCSSSDLFCQKQALCAHPAACNAEHEPPRGHGASTMTFCLSESITSTTAAATQHLSTGDQRGRSVAAECPRTLRRGQMTTSTPLVAARKRRRASDSSSITPISSPTPQLHPDTGSSGRSLRKRVRSQGERDVEAASPTNTTTSSDGEVPPFSTPSSAGKKRRSNTHLSSTTSGPSGNVHTTTAPPIPTGVDFFRFPTSLVGSLGKDTTISYGETAVRHCLLTAGREGAAAIPLDHFNPWSILSVATSAPGGPPAQSLLADVYNRLPSCSTSSLVESDANANLRDLYQALAKTSPSTTGTGLQKQSKDDRCEDNETGIAGVQCSAAGVEAILSVDELTQQCHVDAALQKGVRKWVNLRASSHENGAESNGCSLRDVLITDGMWLTPKQSRERLASCSDSDLKASRLQAQVFLRFEFLLLSPMSLDEKLTNELVSFLSSISMSQGPRCLVTFMESVLVETYLLSHKTLLLELYEELGVTPCATLSPGPTPAHAMPSVLAPLSSAATISLAERTLSRDSKVEEAGKPVLKRYPTEDTMRRQIAVPARQPVAKKKKEKLSTSKAVRGDKDLCRRIRGASGSNVPAAAPHAKSPRKSHREGVRRQLFNSPRSKSVSASQPVGLSPLLQRSTTARKSESATVSKKLFSLTEGVERELPVPEEADHSLHATRSSERRAAFSVEDTPIKESEPSRRKTLELRRHMSRGRISIAETPPRRSFYSTSTDKRSRSGLLRRSKTLSQLLAGNGDGNETVDTDRGNDLLSSTDGEGASMGSFNGSVSILADPFSPPRALRNGSAGDDGVFSEAKARRPRQCRKGPPSLNRSKSEGQARLPSLSRLSTTRSPSSHISTLDSETVLSDLESDAIILKQRLSPALGDASPRPETSGRRVGRASVHLSVSSTPRIEGIDKLLTSPLVSTPGSGMDTSFF